MRRPIKDQSRYYLSPVDPSKVFVIDDFLYNFDLAAEEAKNLERWGVDTYGDGCMIGTDWSSDHELMQHEINHRVQKELWRACDAAGIPRVSFIYNGVLLVSTADSPFKVSRHIDHTIEEVERCYTFNFHWMGEENCGGLHLFNDFDLDSEPVMTIWHKPNRLVIFPSCYPHAGFGVPGTGRNGHRIAYSLFTHLEQPYAE